LSLPTDRRRKDHVSARYIGEIYRDAGGEYRWRVRASNGRIVADSAEGYENRVDCAHMLATLLRVDEVVSHDES
jgi:uncharacterized protein YegP (UPF0339 family)